MGNLSEENSSLLFEVGSVSTKLLLTSCEQTEARTHLTEAERASRRAGGQRAENAAFIPERWREDGCTS